MSEEHIRLADRTNGRAYVTTCRLSVRPSVCLSSVWYVCIVAYRTRKPS